MVMSTALRADAIPGTELERIRGRGTDDFGNPLVVSVVDEAGGTPLRCCLREAVLGERVALIAYQPSKIGGPYAEVGPVFIHAEACDGYTAPDRYPDGFRQRKQLLRAYDARGAIVDAIIARDGDEAESVVAAFFSRPEIAYIHSRNVLYGCYMFTIRRPD